MMRFIKSIILIAILVGINLHVRAQSAVDYYNSAKTTFENGNTDECLVNLKSCEIKLGGSNPKIESLKCQAFMMKDDWIAAAIAFTNYERLSPNSARNAETYAAMLELKQEIWIQLEEIEKKKKEEQEQEIKDDFALAVTEAEEQAALTARKQAEINAGNENSLYEAAVNSKDKELLELYQAEIGTTGDNGKTIAVEIDKQNNPNKYIVPAVESGDLDKVSYLVQLGADQNTTNANGESLFHISVRQRNVDMLEHLCRLQANLEAKNSLGETPLLQSIKNGFYSGTLKLLEEKANPNAVNNAGKSVLYYCLLYKQPAIIAQLVKYRVDVNLPVDLSGISMTPLYYSVFYLKDQPMVSALLSIGANVNNYSNKDWTPLMAAVYSEDVAMVELLLNNKADINLKGPYKWTALHFAVRKKNIALVMLLVKGADKNALDNWKRTPLGIARERKYQEIISILKNG
jgi:ankyrin repeat protein